MSRSLGIMRIVGVGLGDWADLCSKRSLGLSLRIAYFRSPLILGFVLSLCFGCSSESISNSNAETASSLMRDGFWGTGDNADLPRVFESVCDPDPESCGDSHFYANEDQYMISFRRFPTVAGAVEEFEKIRREASREIRAGDVRNSEGLVVGRKVIVWQDVERYPDTYELVWLRGNRLATVSAERFESINLYETDRGL